MQRGVVQEVVASYLDLERASLEVLYVDFEQFDAAYTAPASLYEAVREAAVRQQIAYDAEQEATSEPLLTVQIKALVAQRLFGTEGFYRVMNQARAEEFRRAVALLEAQE